MKPTYIHLVGAILISASATAAQAADGWALKLWPFGGGEATVEQPAGEKPSFSLKWPKMPQMQMPQMFPSRPADPNGGISVYIVRPVKQLNTATRKLWDGTVSMFQIPLTSQPKPRLYEDPVSVEDFIGQQRIDP
jgi:hypothetical protein